MHKHKTRIKHLGWLGAIIVLAVAISACNKQSKRAAQSVSVTNTLIVSSTSATSPTDTLVAFPTYTRTRHPTRTPTITRTRRPTLSPTITLTRTPKHTRTSTPTSTNTRWQATDIPLVRDGTPTPLPTPPSAALDYQLKVWNEAQALELVEIAEQFSFADNIPMPWGEKRFNYQDDQAAIRLAAQEALHRLPEVGFKEKLEWRIALADTIQDSTASDAWILQQIEDSLNSGRVSPDNLDALLIPFGFQVGEQRDAPNLFGDGRLAQVLWITRLDRGSTGLYAALRQDEQGLYTLVKIYSTWLFNFGFDGWYGKDGYNFLRIEDHTGDVVPEVILHSGYHNGSFCGYDLVIFQWSHGQFVRADQDQFHLDECNAEEMWKYGTPGENGAEPIEIRKAVSFPSGVWRYKLYVWNGERYELSESWLEPPETFDKIASRWVTFAMDEGDYAAILEKVPQYLSDESQMQERTLEMGPSYPDYLRFQLGLAYAFQSAVPQARAVFEQIIQTTSNPLTATVPQAAQAYLDNFNGDADLYRACQAALNVMEKASSEYDIMHLREAWGYQPDDFGSSYTLCNLSTAFQQIMTQIDVAQFAQAPEKLTQAGVLIRDSIAIDLDQDKHKEWVLFVDTPGDYPPVNLWILLNTSNGVLPLQVSDQLPYNNTDTARLEVNTIISPDGAVIDFIRAGDHLYAFQLNIAEPSIELVLYVMYPIESYTFFQSGSHLELEVISSQFCDHCKETYRWIGNDFESIYPGQPDSNQVAEAETALLVDWMSGEAIPLLKNITKSTTYSGRPRLLYLLGLAYELAGDDTKAVQTYWTLWCEYPESAYARLAQAKLELSK